MDRRGRSGYRTNLSNYGREHHPQNWRRPATFTQINPDTKFMDNEDVEGIHLLNDFDLVRELQVRLGELAKGPTNFFPVMWPVFLSTKNVHSLATMPYVMVPKPCGPRFLLYIDPLGRIFLENMTQHIFRVDEDHAIFFETSDGRPITDTILDGVITREKSDGEATTGKLTFVIRDAIRCNGNDLTKSNILQRIACIKEEILIPRTYARKNENEAFHLDIVECHEAHQTENYLSDELAHRYKYPVRYLNFYPRDKGYLWVNCGTKNIFRWQENDIQDFSFRLIIPKGIAKPKVAELHIGGSNLSELKHDTIALTEEMEKLHGCIIDCHYVDHQWIFIKQRHDRNHPNGRRAVMGKMEALENAVSRHLLLTNLEESKGLY